MIGQSQTTGRRGWAAVVLTAAITTAVIGGVGVGVAGAHGASGTGKARGSPVTIGLITDAGGPEGIGTSASVEQGAKAAVAYVNAHLAGLEGHKVTLSVCANQNSPSGGQTCANDMVRRGVVAVVEPSTGQGQTEVPIIVGAGIPYVVVTGASTAELTSPGAYDLEGGIAASLGAMALSAWQHGIKQTALIVENVPAAVQGAQEVGGIVYKAAGVRLDIVAANEGTADISPQLQSAVSNGADAVGVIGDVTLCRSFLKAYRKLGLALPRYVLSTCQAPSILDSPTLDKALAGSYITTTPRLSRRDTAEYAAIMKRFAPKVNPNPDVSSTQADGVTPVLALASIMKGSTQPVTAAGIKQQIGTATNVTIPLSGGLTLTCNGTAIPLLRSVCSSSAALGVIQSGKSGRVTHVAVYNTTPLY